MPLNFIVNLKGVLRTYGLTMGIHFVLIGACAHSPAAVFLSTYFVVVFVYFYFL